MATPVFPTGEGEATLVFKRRDQLPWLRWFSEVLWPRGGWVRAATYIKHRMRRLPGSPEEIARGVFAGAFTVFTPFFGLHFPVAAILARLMRGSMLAGVLATFLGNPLTYLPIAYVSMKTGHFLLGTDPRGTVDETLFQKFAGAAGDLWHNFKAMFTPERADWTALGQFHDDVFFPYMVGCLIPGVIAGSICYFISLPLIRTYQKRRALRLQKKMDKLRGQAGAAE